MPSTTSLILNDGTQIPWIAFGTGTALYGKDASTQVTLAIDSGFIHLDCAQSYRNEESMGEGIRASGKPRSELYIVTKLKKLAEGQTVRQSLEESLRKIGVDHVDHFLIHKPTAHVRDGKSILKEVWRGMEEVKRAGLAVSIGVSNFTIPFLKEICEGATILPAVNQIEFHAYLLKAVEPILDYGRELGIVTASYSGLSPLTLVPDGPVTPVIEHLRERLEKTLGFTVTDNQVLMKWTQQKGVIVVTTTSKESRMKEYLYVIDLPDLTPEDMAAIDEAGAKHHYRQFCHTIYNEVKQ